MGNRKPLTREEALLRMAGLCARSEQCEGDIARKLAAKGMGASDVEWVLGELRERGFVDAVRFARSFTNDKVRFSAWGRIKIRAALAAKRIPSAAVTAAMEQIDPEEYADAALRTARAKAATLDMTDFMERRKLYRHMLSRGFESAAAVTAIRGIMKEEE